MVFCGQNLSKLVNFFLMSCKNNLSIFIWGSCTEHKSSYSCYVMIDHHVIHLFYIFLLPLSSIRSSGFHPIFTIDNMRKCEHSFAGAQPEIFEGRGGFVKLGHFDKDFIKKSRKKTPQGNILEFFLLYILKTTF